MLNLFTFLETLKNGTMKIHSEIDLYYFRVIGTLEFFTKLKLKISVWE